MVEHFLAIVNASVTSSLGANQTSAERETFAGQHTMKFVLQPLVLAIEIADFTSADADVAGGHVFVRADVPEQFGRDRFCRRNQ